MTARGINIDRVSVKVSPDQITWLNAIAKAHATSVSDVIRRLIDETMGAYVSRGSPSGTPFKDGGQGAGSFQQRGSPPQPIGPGFTND